MKLKFNLLMLLAVLFMAACSDDDGPEKIPAQEIAQKYDGYSVTSHGYMQIPLTTPGESLTITANEDGSCNIAFPSLSGYGNYTTTDVVVTTNSNGYALSGNGKVTMGMSTENQNEYDYTVAGTISSDKKTVSIVFTLAEVMRGLTIEFKLGDAPAYMVVAGVYNGGLDVTVQGAEVSVEGGEKLTIKSQDNEKVELTLTEFKAMATIGEMVIPDVEVKVENSTYILSGAVDTEAGSFQVKGTIEGTVKDGEASVVFSITPGSMPMVIDATFAGKK